MPELIATSSEIESSIVINENEGGLLLPDESLEEYFARKEQEMIDEMVAEQERNADAERARMEQEKKLEKEENVESSAQSNQAEAARHALNQERIRNFQGASDFKKFEQGKVIVGDPIRPKDNKTYSEARSERRGHQEKAGQSKESSAMVFDRVTGKSLSPERKAIIDEMKERNNVPPEALASQERFDKEIAEQGFSISKIFQNPDGPGKVRIIGTLNPDDTITFDMYPVAIDKGLDGAKSKSGLLDVDQPAEDGNGELAIFNKTPKDDVGTQHNEDLNVVANEGVYGAFDFWMQGIFEKGAGLGSLEEGVSIKSSDASKKEEVSNRQNADLVVEDRDTLVQERAESDATPDEQHELAVSLSETKVSVPETTIVVTEAQINALGSEDDVALEKLTLPVENQRVVETSAGIQIESPLTIDMLATSNAESRVITTQETDVAAETAFDEESASSATEQPVPAFETQAVVSEVLGEEGAFADQAVTVVAPQEKVSEGYDGGQQVSKKVETQNSASEQSVTEENQSREGSSERQEVLREEESVIAVREHHKDATVELVPEAEGVERTVTTPRAEANEKEVGVSPAQITEKKPVESMTSRPEVAPTRPSSEDKKEIVIESTPRLPEKNGIRLVRSPRTEESRPERSSAVSIKENSVNRSPAELSKPYEVRTSSPVTRVESAYPRPTLQPKAALQQDVPTTSVEIPASHSRPALTLNGVTLKRAS